MAYNKSEKQGIFISGSLLILYLLFFIYFLWFSNSFDLFIEAILEFGDFERVFYLITFAIGLWSISMVFHKVVIRIFYPDTKEEQEYKKQNIN